VLPVEFDAVDALEFHVVVLEDALEVVDAGFVGFVAVFEAFPAEGLGGFAAQAELGVFFVRGLFYDDEEFTEPGGCLAGYVDMWGGWHG